MAERDHRIDAGGAAGGEGDRQQADEGEGEGDDDVGRRVGGGDLVGRRDGQVGRRGRRERADDPWGAKARIRSQNRVETRRRALAEKSVALV